MSIPKSFILKLFQLTDSDIDTRTIRSVLEAVSFGSSNSEDASGVFVRRLVGLSKTLLNSETAIFKARPKPRITSDGGSQRRILGMKSLVSSIRNCAKSMIISGVQLERFGVHQD